MDDLELRFMEVCKALPHWLDFFDDKAWRVKEGSHVSKLIREDGIMITIRRHHRNGSLEIRGAYTNGNYVSDSDTKQNKIGSKVTTAPRIIAKGIYTRLLPFVIEQTEKFKEIDKVSAERDRVRDTYCEMLINASEGRAERRTCNITSASEFNVRDKYHQYGDIGYEIRVRYDNQVDFVHLDHLTIDEACKVVKVLKVLQNVRDAKETKREGAVAEA